jgi:hypothetical protein
MRDKNFFDEQSKSISFPVCFDRFLNDLVEAMDLLNEYLFPELFTDNVKKFRKDHGFQKDQEALASGFQEKITRVNYDIKLIKSKKIKGKLHGFKEQNDMIISLVWGFIIVAGIFFSSGSDAEEKEKAKPLYKKLTLGLKTLEIVILEYNKKAQKSHTGKLITVASAREEVKQAILNYAESDPLLLRLIKDDIIHPVTL